MQGQSAKYSRQIAVFYVIFYRFFVIVEIPFRAFPQRRIFLEKTPILLPYPDVSVVNICNICTLF
ncbi:MAG TPA: hypothetical protein DEO95_05190 [Ruminococcaceae bacterium]|nr:hypothetical protein [Oscillospiraceae bacterium]